MNVTEQFNEMFVKPHLEQQEKMIGVSGCLERLGRLSAEKGEECALVSPDSRDKYVKAYLEAGGSRQSVQSTYGYKEYRRMVPVKR